MDRKKFFRWKVMLTVLSLFAVILIKSNADINNVTDYNLAMVWIREISYELALGTFSSMILVWFIDEINGNIQYKQSEEKEKRAIKRTDKILQQYINRYITMFYCVATPIEERKVNDVEMPKDFALRDMRDLYERTFILNEGIKDSSLEKFLSIELILRKHVNSVIRSIDFEHFPIFSDLLLEFISVSLKYDCHEALLEIEDLNQDGKPVRDMVKEILENDADDFYEALLAGKEYEANLSHLYIFLYEMMKKERAILLKYKAEIEKL